MSGPTRGIQANEVKPLSGPLEYKPGISLPRASGIITLSASRFSISSMERKKYVVPTPQVTGQTEMFELPETYRRGSLEAYVDGTRIEIKEEYSSRLVSIWRTPAVGEEVVFNYTPYSNVGGSSKRQAKTIIVDSTKTLTRNEVLQGSVVFDNNTPIEVTLPTLTETNNGIAIQLMRYGWGEVTLFPSGGMTLNGGDSHDIELPWESFELLLDFENSNWILFN